MHRIPSLDGLRAISVLLVIWSHVGGHGGTFGVKVFFVISGFLITSLLVSERTRTGSISLRKFYLRRTLRIFPAAYAYIIAIALFAAVGILSLNRGDLAYAISYLMSYHETEAARPLQQLWSLSVEEQFYFLWPAILILANRWGKAVSITTFVAMPVLRMGLWLFGFKSALLHLLPFSIDALAIGCWMGQVKTPKIAWPWLWLILGALLMEVHPESLTIGRRPFRFFQDSAVHILIFMAVAGSIAASGWWYRVLNSKLMAWIGTLSYSLYLWQEPFAFSKLPISLKVVAIFVAASLSYYLVERPFLHLKDKLEFSQKLRSAATA